MNDARSRDDTPRRDDARFHRISRTLTALCVMAVAAGLAALVRHAPELALLAGLAAGCLVMTHDCLMRERREK